jgi:hypothetical protein
LVQLRFSVSPHVRVLRIAAELPVGPAGESRPVKHSEVVTPLPPAAHLQEPPLQRTVRQIARRQPLAHGGSTHPTPRAHDAKAAGAIHSKWPSRRKRRRLRWATTTPLRRRRSRHPSGGERSVLHFAQPRPGRSSIRIPTIFPSGPGTHEARSPIARPGSTIAAFCGPRGSRFCASPTSMMEGASPWL